MELEEIQSLISKAFEKANSDQILPLINWLDGEITKYRGSCLCKIVFMMMKRTKHFVEMKF